MSQTPDLSKIVNIIMQNPSLIEEISSLVKSSEDSVEESEKNDTKIQKKIESEGESVSVSAPQPHAASKEKRRELLNAMKPYLSENRRSAIDSMSSILDILDVMVRKES